MSSALSTRMPSTHFAEALNNMQGSGLSSVESANRVIELVEQVPEPIRAAVGTRQRSDPMHELASGRTIEKTCPFHSVAGAMR